MEVSDDEGTVALWGGRRENLIERLSALDENAVPFAASTR